MLWENTIFLVIHITLLVHEHEFEHGPPYLLRSR